MSIQKSGRHRGVAAEIERGEIYLLVTVESGPREPEPLSVPPVLQPPGPRLRPGKHAAGRARLPSDDPEVMYR